MMAIPTVDGGAVATGARRPFSDEEIELIERWIARYGVRRCPGMGCGELPHVLPTPWWRRGVPESESE